MMYFYYILLLKALKKYKNSSRLHKYIVGHDGFFFFHFKFFMKIGPFCFFFNHIALKEALKNVKRGSKLQEYTLGHDRYLFFHFEFLLKNGPWFLTIFPY